jgi:hypothetical protein
MITVLPGFDSVEWRETPEPSKDGQHAAFGEFAHQFFW